MDSFKALTKLYDRWLFRNKFNPLISADDLLYDHHRGEITRNRYNDRIADDQHKIEELWSEYLANDKRSFNEYFSEEFGFTCDDSITYKQMKVLCEKLIGRKQ